MDLSENLPKEEFQRDCLLENRGLVEVKKVVEC